MSSHRVFCVLSHFSRVRLFATLWTVAHQVPLFMRSPRQECWSELSCPPSGDLPNRGIELRPLWLLPCRQILYCQATREAHLLNTSKLKSGTSYMRLRGCAWLGAYVCLWQPPLLICLLLCPVGKWTFFLSLPPLSLLCSGDTELAILFTRKSCPRSYQGWLFLWFRPLFKCSLLWRSCSTWPIQNSL